LLPSPVARAARPGVCSPSADWFVLAGDVDSADLIGRT